MDIHVMLNLIAYVLIIVGTLLAGGRLCTAEDGAYGCRYALTFSWLCVIAGLILLIVTLYVGVQWQNLLHEIAYAVMLGGVLIACPLLACREDSCHSSMISCKLITWKSFTAGLILLVIPVYLSVSLQHTLATVAYGLFLLGLLLVTHKLFKSVFGAFAWFCFLAGFILPIVAIYQ